MQPRALLQSVSTYPLPRETLDSLAAARGLPLDDDLMHPYDDPRFMRTLADVYRWLACAPAVAQGGQSFSFTDEDKRGLRAEAQRIYARFGGAPAGGASPYGYRGESL